MRLTPTIRPIPALAAVAVLGALVGSPLAVHAGTPASAPRATLAAGQGLAPGQQLTAPDGRSTALMKQDGDLVVADSGGTELWSSRTSGWSGAAATLGSDGNLVVTSTDGAVRFATGTGGNTGDAVSLANGGVLGVTSRGGLPLWSSTHGRTGYTTAQVPAGGQVTGGQRLWGSSRYSTVQQGDGNLVEYDGATGAALWSTRTSGVGGARTVLQGDGNLVTYAPNGTAVWNSRTAGSGANRLVLQGDGNLVLYAPTRAVWSRETGVLGGQGAAVVAKAAAMRGYAYCYGGGTTGGPSHGSGGSGCGGSTVGFDCSGLALYAIYQALHVTLPHYTGAQATAGGTKITSQAALQPGDLAFFGGSSAASSTHVAIYAGNGTYWDSATYGTPVGLRTAAHEAYVGRFDGGVRYWH